jgi:hypothetical protein
MKTLFAIFIVAFIGIFSWVATLLSSTRGSGQWVNCTVAEFHPDYSPKIKQLCRELGNTK